MIFFNAGGRGSACPPKVRQESSHCSVKNEQALIVLRNPRDTLRRFSCGTDRCDNKCGCIRAHVRVASCETSRFLCNVASPGSRDQRPPWIVAATADTCRIKALRPRYGRARRPGWGLRLSISSTLSKVRPELDPEPLRPGANGLGRATIVEWLFMEEQCGDEALGRSIRLDCDFGFHFGMWAGPAQFPQDHPSGPVGSCPRDELGLSTTRFRGDSGPAGAAGGHGCRGSTGSSRRAETANRA